MDVETILSMKIKGFSNISELMLTILISSFLLKFILRIPPEGCFFVVPTKISIFDIIFIIFLCVFSVVIFIYFILNEIKDEKSKILFLNQRLVNVILSLLGLFYLFNWFDEFCINYRIWVSIYSYIALPCCLALPFIFLFVREIKQDFVKKEKFKLHDIRILLTKTLKKISFITYETLLLILVILFYYTLPFFYPFTNIGCAWGLEYKVHYSTILFLIAISLISIISFRKPILTKKKHISDVFPMILLRFFISIATLLGRMYFVSYQYGNCISIAQNVWTLIISTTWILSISLGLFILIYSLDIGRRYLRIHKSN